MGTSLTGLKIKDSYSGLLKTTDNGALGASAKLITDGLGNSSGVYLGTSGNVGIGTPTPDALLDVEGLVDYQIMAKYNATNYTEYGYFGLNVTGSGNPYVFKLQGTERMRIDSSGNALLSGGGYLATDSITNYSSAFTPLSIGGNSYLVFKSSSTERMRITSGGYLKASNDGSYVGSASNVHELRQTNSGYTILDVSNTTSNPYGQAILFDTDVNNTTNWFLLGQGASTVRFKVWSNGNVVNTNNSYGAISDAKLKENVIDATPKLDDLMQVKIRNFNYIGSDEKQLGVVAQELETIFPAMIDESPDFEEREVELRDENGEIVYETEQVLVSEEVAEELDADGNVITPAKEAVYETVTTDRPVMTTEKFDLGTTTKSVKYSVFVPMLIKAIQELKAEVDALKGA